MLQTQVLGKALFQVQSIEAHLKCLNVPSSGNMFVVRAIATVVPRNQLEKGGNPKEECKVPSWLI